MDTAQQVDKQAFIGFPKMARFSRDCVITEKIDGTNAQIFIGEGGEFLTGSRTRWITPQDDNYGFSRWAHEHREELILLGPGSHFGEWWGSGIQRGYGLPKGERRFSLFNASRWSINEAAPKCCHVVPVLWDGGFDEASARAAHSLTYMNEFGSFAAPGFMQPEGVVIYHTAANMGFKKTILNDDKPKSLAE